MGKDGTGGRLEAAEGMEGMNVWTGTVQLFGTTTRGGGPDPGDPVAVRIVLDGDRLTVDRKAGTDGVGAPRWVKVEPRKWHRAMHEAILAL